MIYTVTGRMIDDKTLSLDQPISLSGEEVRVTVESISPKRRSPLDVLEEIHQRQKVRGHHPPTKGGVDAFVRQERESWD